MSEKKTKSEQSMNDLIIKEGNDVITPFMKLVKTDSDQALLYLNNPKENIDVTITSKRLGNSVLMMACQYINLNLLKAILNHSSIFKNSIDPANKCTICCNANTNIQLPCKHTFHYECLNRWTQEFDAKTTDARCPNCSYVYKQMPASTIINKKNKAHKTALHIICSKLGIPGVDLTPFISLLIEHKADVNILNAMNETALQLLPFNFFLRKTLMEKEEYKNVSERNKYINIVKILIRAKCNINNLNSANYTFLDEVCRYDNSTSIVNILVDNDVDINKISRSDGKSPLFIAIHSNNLNIAKFLLQHKADPNHKNTAGISPLMRASTLQAYTVRRMPSKVIPIKPPNISQNIQLITNLLNANADIEDVDKGLNTALIKATIVPGNMKIIQCLLEHKANPNTININYETALSLLLDQQHKDTYAYTELLIKYGAYINLQHSYGYTPLMKIIRSRTPNIKLIKLFLKLGAYVNIQTKNSRRTPLMLAITPEIIKLLLEHKSNTYIKCKLGYTAFHYAAERGCLESMKYLRENININQKTNNGLTPLYLATAQEHISCLKYLITEKADIEARTILGNTALFYACKNGRLHALKLLLKHKAHSNSKNKKGKTPLIAACENSFDNFEIIQELINNNADVNNKDRSNYNKTPLHYCASIPLKRNRLEIKGFMSLLNAKANANTSDSKGITPLHILSKRGHYMMVKPCMEHKCDINIQDALGKTPLIYATKNEKSKMIDELLKYNPSLDIQEYETKDTALAWGVYNGNSEIVKKLVDAKANVELKNSKGETPLFELIHNAEREWTDDRKKILKLMVEYKADINTKNIKGHTPLMFSIIHENTDQVKTLLEFKANVHTETPNGMVALDYAVGESVSLDIIKLLKKAGADPYRKTSIIGKPQTILEIANQLGNTDILNALL